MMFLKVGLFSILWLLVLAAQPVGAGLARRSDVVLKQPFSDFPLVHNHWVKRWINFFQKKHPGRFRTWLERSYRYAPLMRAIFRQEGLPEDLIYMCMIESGFSARATSSAKAVGYWQFISPTALRFGLLKSFWLDERRDFEKSTEAASRYLRFLYAQFQNWYLAAAAYNMGEKKLHRLIKKHKSRNFWELARKYDFPYETAHYVPQLIAAITIVKAPVLYGFNHLKIQTPYRYEVFYLPGGTNLKQMARHIGESYKKIRSLNPELLKSYIPKNMENWPVRIPRDSQKKVSHFVQTHLM